MLLEILSLGILAWVVGHTHGLQIQLRESQERLNPHLESFIFKNRPRPRSYQVLRGPAVGLHHRWKREGSHPDFSSGEITSSDISSPTNLPVSIPVNGDDLSFILTRVNIADHDLKLRIRRDAGNVEELENNMDCIYAGNASSNWMVLSTCTGVNGVFHHNGTPYQLEQIDPSDQRVFRHKRDFEEPIYVTYPLNSLMNFDPKGMDSLMPPVAIQRPIAPRFDADAIGPTQATMRANSRQKRRTLKGPYTVELAVFVDPKLYTYIGNRYPGTDKQVQTKTMDIVMTLVNAGAKGHWDHALLLSGIDLWNDKPSKNSTVGLAYVGGMCQSAFSCTVNEATTFAAAYIIAHEMGHSLNMVHDGSGQAYKCSADKYIMSPVMSSGATTWSSCSVDSISSFLKSNGDCLTSEYTSEIRSGGPKHDGPLPGKRYDADEQCHYMYGNGWKHFKSSRDAMFSNVCREIWCRKGRQLRTPSASALQGTSCGPSKVCKDSKCLKTSKLQVKNGVKKRVKTTKKLKKKKKKKNKVSKKGKKDKGNVNLITNINAASTGVSKKVKAKKKNQAATTGNNGAASTTQGSNGNKLSTTKGVSTSVNTKVKVKNGTKKKKKPKKFRRIETKTHIIFKERLNFVPGKGWRIKTIRVKKTKRMLEDAKKVKKKKKKKNKKKKKKSSKKKVKKNQKTSSNNNNINIGSIQNGKGPIVAPPVTAGTPERCKPKKLRYVEGRGWWVKVPLDCVKYVTG
ncbi:uncharacterized protein [Macrobrachium rosenbergii]|uniref:uncharacterized protein isoform X2 n=1 Tax=Macrobrachium rosenbergii TaxID=79674 RepID=UPI0034D42EE2